MEIRAPEPEVVQVIDYDITLACGKDITFSLRPDLGDTEEFPENTSCGILLKLRTGHVVRIADAQIAVVARRERNMTLLPKKIEPEKIPLAGNVVQFVRR